MIRSIPRNYYGL